MAGGKRRTEADEQDEGEAAEGEWPGKEVGGHGQAAVLDRCRCKNGPHLIQQVKQKGYHPVAGQCQYHLWSCTQVLQTTSHFLCVGNTGQPACG